MDNPPLRKRGRPLASDNTAGRPLTGTERVERCRARKRASLAQAGNLPKRGRPRNGPKAT